MTWIKLDDNAVDHPKVESLSDRAFRWWIKGLSYASRFLTDGLLPPVFWKKVPSNDRKELTTNNLWDWADPNFLIHDYLHHQTRKEDVEADKERNREKSKAYRERRKAGRRSGDALPTVTGDVTGNASPDRHHPVTDPENREQRTHTENREQTTTPSSRGVRLILSPKEHARLSETHAFVGSVLRVPNGLHAELIGKSGGAHREPELQDWYLALNEQLEQSGTGTGDVFVWLRPRHQALAVSKGWIEAAPKAGPKPPSQEHVARMLAIERGERRR